MDEVSLVEQAQYGNKDALVELIMSRKNEYYRLAYAYMGNQEDALDILQDTIIILYENIRKLKKAEVFHSWAKTILVNLCKRQLKKKRKIISLEAISTPNTPYSLSSEAINKAAIENPTIELQLDIKEELEKLNPNQKEVIILKYFLDLDNEMIAQITNSPVGTVKSRIFNALKRLKQAMEGDYNG